MSRAFGPSYLPGQQITRRSAYAAPRLGEFDDSPNSGMGEGNAPIFRSRAPQVAPMAPMLQGQDGGYAAPQLSYDRTLQAANSGRIARGPSVGTPVARAAGLPQFGETQRDAQDYNDNRGFRYDANDRANTFNTASSDLIGSEAGYNDAQTRRTNTMTPRIAEGADIANTGARSMIPYAPRMAEADIGLKNAQAQQTSQLPADWKTRETGYQKQLQQHQAEIDRLNQQIRLYQEQGGRGTGKAAADVPVSQGESELLNGGMMDQEGALRTINAVRKGLPSTRPSKVPASAPQADDGRDRAGQVASPQIQVGQTATNDQGHKVRFDGKNWNPI